jgi:vancomycin resistance protein YoaR
MSRTKKTAKTTETAVAAAKPEKVVDPKDLQLLQVNEDIISKAQSGFLDVGKALKAIHDQEQFRAVGFDDFEAYCLKKWGYSQNYSNRLIAAYSCHELLKKELASPGEQLPTNEYQLRSLVVLPENEWVKTWKQVLANAADKPITGEMVKAAVEAVKNPTAEKPAETEAKTAEKANKQASASKLVRIGKMVQKVLDEKSKYSMDQLIKLLENIQKLVAEVKAS